MSSLCKTKLLLEAKRKGFVAYNMVPLHGGGGPQVGEVTRLGGVKNSPRLHANLTAPPFRGALSQDY